jgi:hypothetical protein
LRDRYCLKDIPVILEENIPVILEESYERNGLQAKEASFFFACMAF